jgi:hypothetical protein
MVQIGRKYSAHPLSVWPMSELITGAISWTQKSVTARGRGGSSPLPYSIVCKTLARVACDVLFAGTRIVASSETFVIKVDWAKRTVRNRWVFDVPKKLRKAKMKAFIYMAIIVEYQRITTNTLFSSTSNLFPQDATCSPRTIAHLLPASYW